MNPGARDGWSLVGFKYDKETSLCLAHGRGSVTTFSSESQCPSALCLHPKREVVEKLKLCTSLLHFTRLSAVGYRNKRNFRGSQRRERRQERNWEKANIFSQIQGLGHALNSVISQICMTKHKMT